MPSANGGRGEVALLVGLQLPGQPRWRVEDALDELDQLARSAGASVAGRVLQERAGRDPHTLIGRGKALEIQDRCQRGVDLVIFDEGLSGSQQRNLEGLIGRRVIDRTALILDIFAQRARTREGKLQVELAQLDYLLPRLVGRWTHLERLGGGIGTRGPGETQLEADRRRIKQRMAKIREDLGRVRRHRALLRRPRRRAALPTVALVGYTNAGKSSLLNALTRAGVVVEDRLFATLDPVVRPVRLPEGRTVLLTDTVGFLRKLPTQLVAAFKATLEEIGEAVLLLHVMDASHARVEEQSRAVEEILGALGLAEKPVIAVHNKIDLLPAAPFPWVPGSGRAAVSARTGQGLGDLLAEVALHLERRGLQERGRRPVAGEAPRALRPLEP